LQTALSFFVDVTYLRFAEWRAVIARLDGFDSAIVQGQALASARPAVAVEAREHAKVIEVDDMVVRLPDGKPLIAADDLHVAPGERILVTGPTGAGKSTMFRAMAGIWRFGRGTVVVPKGAKVMMLPQRPYFPVATLTAALSYPDDAGAFPRERLAEVLTAVGMAGLVPRLDEEAHWNRTLSLGEQQRLGIARAILQAPDYLFLDQATASLDEPAETALYTLLETQLKHMTLVSIGHRATLAAFHGRQLALVREADSYRLRETALALAGQ